MNFGATWILLCADCTMKMQTIWQPTTYVNQGHCAKISVTSVPQLVGWRRSQQQSHYELISDTATTILEPPVANRRGFLALSSASQDNGGFLLEKSASVKRIGTSTWASPVPEVVSSLDPSGNAGAGSSAACGPMVNKGPTSLPKETSQVKSPTQKQCSDQGQLETVFEAPPESPTALVKISSPYKGKECLCLF